MRANRGSKRQHEDVSVDAIRDERRIFRIARIEQQTKRRTTRNRAREGKRCRHTHQDFEALGVAHGLHERVETVNVRLNVAQRRAHVVVVAGHHLEHVGVRLGGCGCGCARERGGRVGVRERE